MKTVITSDATKVYIVFNDTTFEDIEKATILKSNVSRILLKKNAELGGIIEILYNDALSDQLHFDEIDNINGVEVTSNLDLYNKLSAIL